MVYVTQYQKWYCHHCKAYHMPPQEHQQPSMPHPRSGQDVSHAGPRASYTKEKPAYITITLIVLCMAAFIAQIISVDFMHLFWMDPYLSLELWRYVTSIFLHGGFQHIFWNMLILYMFGTVLEKVMGGRRYLMLFFVSGIVGNIGYLIFCYGTQSFIPSVGASGAIYGIFGSLAILFPDMRVYLFFAIPMKIVHALAFFIVIDIVFMASSLDNVAHAAHLSGLAFGLIYAIHLKKQVEKNASQRDGI